MQNTPFEIEFISRITDIDESKWNNLSKGCGPFLDHQFLSALESSHSVNAQAGWQPHHLLVYQDSLLVGILPLYIKTHSYGEYVFDFAWANAYQQHGLDYYPKLVSAIPFTPVTGQRLIVAPQLQVETLLPYVVSAIKQRIEQLGLSSMHWLFVDKQTQECLAESGQLSRQSVQFQWFNRDYQNFDDFLQSFTARRRKSVKKERLKIANAEIHVQRKSGDSLLPEDMDFFYQCYQQTYLKRSGHNGYLTQAFFKQLFDTMKQQILLVVASKQDIPVAAALYLFDNQQLCGRYWGALQELDGLHFECCYYQGIEFCIEKNLSSFNPGTQGEHKILRGFEPIFCYSSHWLVESEFHAAVARFLQQEAPQIERYQQQTSELLPYKKCT